MQWLLPDDLRETVCIQGDRFEPKHLRRGSRRWKALNLVQRRMFSFRILLAICVLNAAVPTHSNGALDLFQTPPHHQCEHMMHGLCKYPILESGRGPSRAESLLGNRRLVLDNSCLHTVGVHGSSSREPLRLRGGGFWNPPQRARGGGWFSQFDFTDAETKAIAALREALGETLTEAAKENPDLDTEDRLIRFLRTHDLNVKKTVVLFKKMMKWRVQLKADDIRNQILREFSDNFWDMGCIPNKKKFRRFYFYEPFHALDRKGDLLSIECTGRIQVRKFMRSTSEKEIMTFWTYIMEWNMLKLAQLSRKQGRLVSMAQIKDLEGLSFVQASSKAGMNRFRKVNCFMHDCYPECLSSLTLVNVPPIFGALWRAFRPLLPKRTISKIAVVAGGPATQRAALFRMLPSSDPIVQNGGGVELYVPKDAEKFADGRGGIVGQIAQRFASVAKMGLLVGGVLLFRVILGLHEDPKARAAESKRGSDARIGGQERK
mmetsp:Transcript_13041/g.26079  ORF Transcript_13041/g.26079 Transcript_13041/m.26079 type:complete len:489 (-) Transcript_13041:57-1523(-)